MATQHLTTCQPIPQGEYEVSHHQNCGQGRLLVTIIGTFVTLQDAQRSAQDVLRSTLRKYMSTGWSGYYCDDIDLEFRGLIAGLTGKQEYEYLSEIQIHARGKTFEPDQSDVESRALTTEHELIHAPIGYNTTHSPYDALAPTGGLTAWQTAGVFIQAQQDYSSYGRQFRSSPGTGSFSQTRPQYPNRPVSFIPRSSGQYDETMSFSAACNLNPNTNRVRNTGLPQQKPRKRRHGKNKGASKP